MERWYQVVALSLGGVVGVNALLAWGRHQPLDGPSISLGDVHDQCFRVVRHRPRIGGSGTLAAAFSERPSPGCGRFSGGIHDVFVVHV